MPGSGTQAPRLADSRHYLDVPVLDRHDIHIIHHIDKAGTGPAGLFFRARAWGGEPELREPEMCTQWEFWGPGALPHDLVPYTRVAIAKIQNGELYSETGWPA